MNQRRAIRRLLLKSGAFLVAVNSFIAGGLAQQYVISTLAGPSLPATPVVGVTTSVPLPHRLRQIRRGIFISRLLIPYSDWQETVAPVTPATVVRPSAPGRPQPGRRWRCLDCSFRESGRGSPISESIADDAAASWLSILDADDQSPACAFPSGSFRIG